MGRPRTPILSTDSIVIRAIALAAEHGEFTMVQLADALGVRPSSLYNHVSSKSHLTSLIRTRWLSEVAQEIRSLPPGPERLGALMRQFYARVSAAPALVTALYLEPITEPEALRYYSDIVECIRELGMSREAATAAIALADAFVLGSALDRLSPPFDLDRSEQRAHPHLAWALDGGRSGDHRGARDFGLGLDIVISGILAVAQRDAAPRPTTEPQERRQT